ncbi:mediator complex subunit [Arachnomyces sp. PD_36]|nr:mediator complex subunit [Arachnomyces sp. PD_36]
MASSIEKWKTFLRQCLTRRISADKFREMAKILFESDTIPEGTLVDAVLESRAVTNVYWDPLIPLYVDTLRRLGIIKMPDILNSLLKHSSISQKDHESKASTAKPLAKPSTLLTDYRILQDLLMAVTSGWSPKSMRDARRTLTSVTDWIFALVSWVSASANDENPSGALGTSQDAFQVFESAGILLAALVGSSNALDSLSTPSAEADKNRLAQAISAYNPICADISITLRNRLDALQKGFNIFDSSGSKSLEDAMMDEVDATAMQFESNVIDGPVINSRAGLYIYLNALLVGRPLVDDNMLVNYLNIRYDGQHMVLVEELITAAFDVLSNAMYRNESNRTMFFFRSFLVNKLPPFFADMSASLMDPIPMEVCISRALGRVDPNAFPSFSQLFSMQGNTVLSDVRQEFLFSCALHKLIPESSIERLLGENPMQTLPVGGQYVKENLVAQINANPERAEQLINEMESMEGNAGAIVRAVTELMHGLYAWKWDEEQGESQPVYDEFGSILLLVLAFKHRYNLSPYDLGVSDSNSFVFRLLEQGSTSQRLGDLTETQSKNLGAWITALFIAEGISDESMSSCSPQEFYLLVATLFSQSFNACETGKLEFDTLKGGFEYLLEPFLLPSLVMALTWLSNHIWESESDLSTSLKILSFFVKPSSISREAQAIHSTVLSISARSLEDELKDVARRHPSRTDIKPILDALEPHLSFQQTGSSRRTELDGWTANPGGGGLLSSIRNTYQSLVLWSTNPEISMTPPSYTHRQILAGIHMLGSVRVFRALLDELKLQSETGSGDLALDILATLVCAPLAESFTMDQAACHPSTHLNKDILPRSPILTLRDALLLQHETVAKTSATDPHRAELIVRLHRRVEALMTPPPMAQDVPTLDVNNMMQDIDLQNVGDAQMGLAATGPGGVGEDEPGNLNEMLDAAAAEAAAGGDAGAGGMDNGMGVPGGGGNVMDTSIDDVLNGADMGVGNPEFLDLDMDMDGMF